MIILHANNVGMVKGNQTFYTLYLRAASWRISVTSVGSPAITSPYQLGMPQTANALALANI